MTSQQGSAAKSKQRSASVALVTQAAAANRRALLELFRALLRFISERHVGAGDGVCGAAGGAVAGRTDGSREGRTRRAELLQLQQTGALEQRF